MPNRMAAVQSAIWDNADFTALTGAAQRLYLVLVSQVDTNLCGVVPLRVCRWAALARDTTPATIGKALRELEERAFVVVDRDVEEVLIRTYVKHSGTLKMPKVVIGMARQYDTVRSRVLRAAIIANLPPSALDSMPASLRSHVPEPFASDFRKGFGKGSAEGSGKGSPYHLTTGPRDHGTTTDEVDLPLPLPSVAPDGVGATGAPTGERVTSATGWPDVVHDAVGLLAERELADQPAGTVRSPVRWLAAKRAELVDMLAPRLCALAETSGATSALELVAALRSDEELARARLNASALARNLAAAGVSEAELLEHPTIKAAPEPIRAVAVEELRRAGVNA